LGNHKNKYEKRKEVARKLKGRIQNRGGQYTRNQKNMERELLEILQGILRKRN
jgi:hypothetical protein